MQFNSTHSAILRGRWLVDKQWADAHMPLVIRLLRGETVDFGVSPKLYDDDGESEEAAEKRRLPVLECRMAGRNVYGVSPYTNIAALPGDSIVMVTLSGPLMKNGGFCSYGMVDHAQVANKLAGANNVAGVIYNIDSPGGQASGTALLGEAIKNLSNTKPVIVHINDGMAASAAMWVASAANEIYVSQKTDQVGSIGVYTTIADMYAHYQEYFKLPVKDVYAPQSTNKNKDYRDAIAGDTTALEEDLGVLADQFINTVATNRPGIKGDAWKTGAMFYAADAKKIGLIDGIKSFAQVVQRMDAMISSQQSQNKSKNMAFEKTLTAAKTDSFAVVDGGFLLEEMALNNVEASLARLEEVEGELATANTNNTALTSELAAEKTTVQNLTAAGLVSSAKITELEGELVKLGKKPSGTGTSLTVAAAAETVTEQHTGPVGLNSPEHPLNELATQRLNRAALKK